MAKKGKVKKGFTTYLLILFLALIATFLIIITIMLFSPFKNILGFQYFTFKNDIFVFNADGDSEDKYFNFENIDNINIDCSFAKVNVERYYNIDNYAIRFENKMTGIARSEQNTDFNYEVYYSNQFETELTVKVHEPEGFLYFNKNITISVLIPTKMDYTLDDTAINITNTSGSINIGNNTKVLSIEGQDYRNYITIGELNIKTNSGKTTIYPYTNSEMNNLNIKTEDGAIEVKKDLSVLGNFEIYSKEGDIEFKNVAVSNSAVLNLNDSKFYVPTLNGNVELTIKNGYFDVDNFYGSLLSNNAVEQMSKATLNIKNFSGNLSLPYVNKSRVDLGTVSEISQIYIRATEGDIRIDDMKGNVLKVETTKGDVNVKSSGTDVDVKTKSGNINVSFDNSIIKNEIDLVSTSGDVKLKVRSNMAFTLNIKNSKGVSREDNNIKIVWIDEITENPLPILGGGKNVNITTNERVEVGFITD